MPEPLSLLDLTPAQLTDLLVSWDQPRYRADQVRDWVWRKLTTDPAEMTNLPKALRERLRSETVANPLEPLYEQRSSNGETIKWLFRLRDGLTIETVLMLYDDANTATRGRRTVCISTQAGCAMGCVFCATGQGGLARNLTSGEIVAQVLAAERWLETARVQSSAGDSGEINGVGDEKAGRRTSTAVRRLTNVVVMGMGEPLANYERTWQALRSITDGDGFGLGARHITLSTVGLPHGIRRMAEEPLQVNLAVSLHAPNDELRSKLAPINIRYPIAEVLAAVRGYIARTHRRVTFEYALMEGINDTPALALQLVGLLRGMLCHVNLIPLNPVAESPYRPATPQRAAEFQALLERGGIAATLRTRRGLDIDAGCGQLRRRVTSS